MSPLGRAAASLLAAAALLAGCGGDETSSTRTVPATIPGVTGASGVAGFIDSCVESFNDSADPTLPRIARLAHEPGGHVLVGSYAGPEFRAETYDVDFESGDGTETTVTSGACAVTEVSADLGTLYLFVTGDDGEWHNLLVTDPDVPLADDPRSQLAGVRTVELENVKPPQVPELIP